MAVFSAPASKHATNFRRFAIPRYVFLEDDSTFAELNAERRRILDSMAEIDAIRADLREDIDNHISADLPGDLRNGKFMLKADWLRLLKQTLAAVEAAQGQFNTKVSNARRGVTQARDLVREKVESTGEWLEVLNGRQAQLQAMVEGSNSVRAAKEHARNLEDKRGRLNRWIADTREDIGRLEDALKAERARVVG